MKQKKIDY